MSGNAYLNSGGSAGTRTQDQRLKRASKYNNINDLDRSLRAETGHFQGARITNGAHGLVRALVRCECSGCPLHSRNRCKRMFGRTNGMHPIAMHRYAGRLFCHRCLNLFLERHCLTLYTSQRTWIK